MAVLSGGGGDDGGGGGDGRESGPAAPKGSVRVSFAYSPEKEKLLKPLIRRFNSERAKVNGKPVFVEGEVVSSGEAESKLAAGDPRAHRLVAGLLALGAAAQLRGRPQRSWPTTTRRSSARPW